MNHWGSRVLTLCGALLVAWGLAGCAPAHDAPATTSAVPGNGERSGAATPTPEPTFDPDGTADDNLPYFDAVNTAVLAENPDAMGMDFINALVEAGFEKSTMEVTEDYSTVGNRAESIQFSVQWNDECLIGQNGDSVDGYHSVVMDALDSGTCLVGNTRALD